MLVWVLHRPMEQCHSWVRIDAAGEVVDAIRRSTILIIIQFCASALVEYARRSGEGLPVDRAWAPSPSCARCELFSVNDRADWFALHRTFQALRLPEIEHEDGKLIVHA